MKQFTTQLKVSFYSKNFNLPFRLLTRPPQKTSGHKLHPFCRKQDSA